MAFVPTSPDTGVILTPQLPPDQLLAETGGGMINEASSVQTTKKYSISFDILRL